MKVIINDFVLQITSKLNHHPGISCFFTAVRDVINFAKKDMEVTDLDVFLAFNGANIAYKKGEFLGFDFCNPKNFEIIGSNYEVIGRQRIKGIIDKIEPEFLKRNPVLCCAQTQHLNYHEIYLNNVGRMHMITAFGINQDEGFCYVYDPHIRLNADSFARYAGPFAISNLANAIDHYLIFSSLDKFCVSVQDYNLGDIIDIYLRYGHPSIESYFLDCLEDLSRECDIYQTCININHDIKLNGPCYILNYLILFCGEIGYYQHIENLELLKLDWLVIANSFLISGCRKNPLRVRENLIAAVKKLDQHKSILSIM